MIVVMSGYLGHQNEIKRGENAWPFIFWFALIVLGIKTLVIGDK